MSKKDFHLHDGKRGSAIAIRCDTARQQQQNCRGAERWDGEDPLAAPPVDNEANDKLIVFLSEVLSVPKSAHRDRGGMTGRDKLVSILDLDGDTVTSACWRTWIRCIAER